MSPEETAAVVTAAVLHELSKRKGFDDWWDDIERDIRAEIIAALDARVLAAMSP